MLLLKLVRLELKFFENNIENDENNESLMSEETIFFWAVLHNRTEIAKLFLQNYCQNPIFDSLLASKIFKEIANLLPDEAESFLSSAE